MYSELSTYSTVLYDAKTQSTASLYINVCSFEVRNEIHPGIESEQHSSIIIQYDICVSGSNICIDRANINMAVTDWNEHYSTSTINVTGSFNDLINHSALIKAKDLISNRYGLGSTDWVLS